MLEVDARQFVELGNVLRAITLMGRQNPEKAKEGGNADPSFAQSLRDKAVMLDEMGLRASKGALLELATAVEHYGPYNDYADAKVGSVCHILRLETDGRKFLQVQREDLYSPSHPLFGKIVDEKFPSVAEEISEAGKCLALRRPTATVMHLMRVLEVGLQALAERMVALTVPVKSREAMSICRDFRAIIRGAAQARPAAALIVGGLLLLSIP